MSRKLKVIGLRLAISLASTSFVLGLMAFGVAAGWQTPVAEAQSATKTIQVQNGLPRSLCGPDWHWIITGISDASLAPASISVTFSIGGTVQVPLEKVTGGTAHYTST